MLVMKFGGTSVGDGARIAEVVKIVKAELASDPKITEPARLQNSELGIQT